MSSTPAHPCRECETVLHTRALYCSNACKWVARKRKHGIPCDVCGEPTGWTKRSGKVSVTHKTCGLTPCGTLTAYKRGCRCAECTESNRKSSNEDYAKRRARVGLLVRACVVCTTSFNPRSNQVTCSPECRKAHLGRLGTHYSRAAYFGVPYERIDRAEVFARDNWMCGICSLPVDATAKFPDPGAATLDHIVAMSAGGGHVLANVQLAHFYCNTAKGARHLEVIAC